MKRPFGRPPAPLRRPGVTLDNIALVPASLLPFKPTYQAIANELPRGTQTRRASTDRMAAYFMSDNIQITTWEESPMPIRTSILQWYNYLHWAVGLDVTHEREASI